MTIKKWALDKVGSPYIMGCTGAYCTPTQRIARGKQYPDYRDKIYQYCPFLSNKQVSCKGCKYDGKRAYDCAQLTRRAAESIGLDLPSGATNQWKKAKWALKGEISNLPSVPCFVYRANGDKMAHTGIALGDGTCVHAKGHAYGVLHEVMAGMEWTHFAILTGQYTEVEMANIMNGISIVDDQEYPLLQRGRKDFDESGNVHKLQELLNAYSPEFALKVDGNFGPLTEQAVMSVQTDMDTAITGITTQEVWDALRNATTAPPDVETPQMVEVPLDVLQAIVGALKRLEPYMPK